MFQLVVLFLMSSGNQPVTLSFDSGQLRLEAVKRIQEQARAQCRNVEFYY